MNKLLTISAVLLAFALPSLAQGTHLSLTDQKRFDSYYSRWQSYKATNNQKEVRSMEGRMQDVYRHYGIPANTPYRNIASGGSGIWGPDRNWERESEIAIGPEIGIAIGIATTIESTTTADGIEDGISTIGMTTTATRTTTATNQYPGSFGAV